MELAWELPLPPTQKLVLLELVWRADGDGESFPRIATIERRTGAKRRTVFEQIAQLQSLGLLTRETRPGKGQRVQFRVDFARLRALVLQLTGKLPDDDQTGAAGAPVEGQSANENSTGAAGAPVRQAHQLEGEAAKDSNTGQGVTDGDQCAPRTGALSAPVREAHPTGAPAAPDWCASRTAIRATLIEPSGNPHPSALARAGEGEGLVAPNVLLSDDQRLTREDEFNRLSAFDQQTIEPFLSKLPTGISLAVFAAFVHHRGAIRKQLSYGSFMQAVLQLLDLRRKGIDLNESLKHTIKLSLAFPVEPPRTRDGSSLTSKPRANDDFTGATYESTPDDDLPEELRSGAGFDGSGPDPRQAVDDVVC